MVLLDEALQYAGRGWRIFPVHTAVSGRCSCGQNCGKDSSKHPRIRAWQTAATTDPTQITKWWSKWSDANIGVATGGGLIVLDLDGPDEIQRFASIASRHGGLGATLTAQTGRGFHLYLKSELGGNRKVDGLLVRGEGGYVIAPPSLHASGKRYQWVKDVSCLEAPAWFNDWLQINRQHIEVTKVTAANGHALLPPLPDYLKHKKVERGQSSIAERSRNMLGGGLPEAYALKRLTSALATIPANCARDPWLHVGMALHSCHWEAPDGRDLGFELWRAWSETGGDKFQGLHDLETRWRSFGKGSGIGLGSLFHIAEEHGWTGYAPAAEAPPVAAAEPTGQASGFQFVPPAASKEEQPLAKLNEKYSCIGDVGSKCLVMGWVPSKMDPAIEMPSFQTFKSFAERFGNQYVTIFKEDKQGNKIEEQKQLGATWLRWKHRRSYDGIDLVPGAGPVINGNTLNLWRGFTTVAAQGNWDRMKQHLVEVVADGDRESLEYIVKWSAWALQHPGERAEAALVLRGGKGSGKGTFAHAMRQLFGMHGLHISNPKHLVGAFNAHLRNCLLLYADEAFWAGDKQGESTLKALITESTLTIEQKGVDAVQWHNRIHLIMTANAEWVVPASHDERRYAMFNVSDCRVGDKSYFAALHQEIKQGGLQAMLWDLQHYELGDWHPRQIVRTRALTEQKMQSMTPIQEWWEQMLQEGVIAAAPKDSPDTAMAVYLLNHARDFAPRLRDMTPTRLGRFLSQHGCIKLHKGSGNAWRFPTVQKARAHWEKEYGGWDWGIDVQEWMVKT